MNDWRSIFHRLEEVVEASWRRLGGILRRLGGVTREQSTFVVRARHRLGDICETVMRGGCRELVQNSPPPLPPPTEVSEPLGKGRNSSSLTTSFNE